MPSIRDFSGGVSNQELLGKDSGAGIMIDANNVLSSWNGELRKRTGTRIIAQLEKKSRIIPYRLSNNDDAILIFTDENIKGYEINEAGLTPLPVQQQIDALQFPTSGWASNNNGSWATSSNINATPAMYEIFNEHKNPGYSSYTQDTEHSKYVEISNEDPFVLTSLRFIFQHQEASEASVAKYQYYTAATLLWSDDGLEWTPIKTSTSIEFSFAHIGLFDYNINNVYLDIINNSNIYTSHKYWRIQFSLRVGNLPMCIEVKNINVASSSAIYCDFATEIPEKFIKDIKFTQVDKSMYFACKEHTPMVFSQVSETPFSNFIPESTTDVWATNGFPSCVSAYQNRLCFAGFEEFPNRVIGSEFGKFDNFTVKTEDVLPTDPISADCVELRSEIENLWAGNNALYVLSSDGVSMLDAQGGIVATDQINFKLRNREPADGMTPTTKDDIMIYLGNDRRKIFITDYDFIVQRFKAKDLAIGYNGFLTSRIVALHYASRKCSLIYGYKDDGNMLALLFDTDMQKNALFPCDIGGDIKDMQVFKSGDKFRVLMVAQIEDRWYLIEKNEQPEYAVMDFMTKDEKSTYTETVMQNGMYLDYMTRRYFDTPVDIIDDVPYGIGEQVAVFADGKYIGEKICSAGGPYAWSSGDRLIYTRSNLPQVGDEVLDKDEQPISESEILSVGNKTITVKERDGDSINEVDLYAWSDYLSITCGSLGTLSRNESTDGVLTSLNRYKFGWGDYFTFQPAAIEGQSVYTDGGQSVDNINSIEQVIFYTRSQTPSAGDEVYDADFRLIGNIEGVGTTDSFSVNTPTKLPYVLINGKKCYIYKTGNTRHDISVPAYKIVEYSRSVIDDLATGPVGIRLDEPAKDFILGYNYDAYAVLKLATPYANIKYPKEVSTYLINTGYLEIGNSFDNLQPILNNMKDKLDLFDKPTFVNGEYTKTMDKLDNSPYIILRNNVPMPFMITGIDFKVDYSNYQGGI